MTLSKRGSDYYGDTQADIRDEIIRFSKVHGYEATHFADAACACGSVQFRLATNEDEGVAVRICTGCDAEHPIGDTGEFEVEAEVQERLCTCGSEALEITVGVSLDPGSENVRWLYVGGRCPRCGRIGVFGDWKNEYCGYEALLSRV